MIDLRTPDETCLLTIEGWGGHGPTLAACRRWGTQVIVTELAANPGRTITDSAEAVAIAVRANWPTVTHIFEHYAECSTRFPKLGESFALTWPCPDPGTDATAWLPFTARQITELLTESQTRP